jgi:hypothetical protein
MYTKPILSKTKVPYSLHFSSNSADCSNLLYHSGGMGIINENYVGAPDIQLKFTSYLTKSTCPPSCICFIQIIIISIPGVC